VTDARYQEVDLVAAVKQRQRASFVATGVSTLVLVGAVGGFLLFSLERLAALNGQVADKAAQLATVTASLQETQNKITMLESVVAAKTKEADAATNLAKQLYPLNWADQKILFGQFGRASRFLEAIAEAQRQNAHWGLSDTLQDGFTSPGFANYILMRTAGVTVQSLPARQGAPRPGDIIVYDPPYTMFYFPDVGPSERNEGFVVGMTPLGIASLTRSFTPNVVRVLRTPLSQ
jgi:hypothetical protein